MLERPDAALNGEQRLSGPLRAFLLTRLLGRPLSGRIGEADTSDVRQSELLAYVAVIMTVRSGNVYSSLAHWVKGLQGCTTQMYLADLPCRRDLDLPRPFRGGYRDTQYCLGMFEGQTAGASPPNLRSVSTHRSPDRQRAVHRW